MIVVKWAWRHGVLEVTEFDTLEDAFRSAYWASEEGDEALDCFEIVDGAASEVVHKDDPRWTQFDREKSAEDWRAYQERPKMVAGIKVRGPDGCASEAWWSTHATREAAEEAFRDMPPALLGRSVLVNVPDRPPRPAQPSA